MTLEKERAETEKPARRHDQDPALRAWGQQVAVAVEVTLRDCVHTQQGVASSAQTRKDSFFRARV